MNIALYIDIHPILVLNQSFHYIFSHSVLIRECKSDFQ